MEKDLPFIKQKIHAITRQSKFSDNDTISVPINHLPLFRSQIAIQRQTSKKLLLRTWGGLGDQICAEPTLRFALKSFKDCEISLASEQPELFKHLRFHKVFDLNDVKPNYEKYFLFDTITPPDDSNLVWQFFSHMLTNCVDFPSLCALRCQLPVEDKEIKIVPLEPKQEIISLFNSMDLSKPKKTVTIHAGRHWQSKTFPKDWWNALINNLVLKGIQPILIGADTDDNRGTVDVDASKCIDLRNKLSVNDSIWALHHTTVLLTNDSAPLHMAASGGLAWIGFIATCKHPDFITHWRHGVWQWREKNFGLGGIWDIIDNCPNKDSKVSAEFVDEKILQSWLPDPSVMADWAAEKCNL